MNPQSPTVFESFNARALRPEQVAKTFVAPSFFTDLASRCHSTVVGPRGSGKTSLLKMLQPRALESWPSTNAENFRSTIDFTGVFVPTDISWNRQTIACVESLPANAARAFRTAAFTTQVLHSLVETFSWRAEVPPEDCKHPYRRVHIKASDEKRLVHELAATWGLTPSTETFIGLKHSLSRRNTEIWSLAQVMALSGQSTAYPQWIGLDFLSCTVQAVELFDDAVGEPDSRWALLFDELELAPGWIMDGLLTALRSTAPRILFKLALSPFDEQFYRVRDALNASPLQDFNEIVLWHAKKEDGKDFSTRLFINVCEDQGRSITSLEDLVGKSPFDAGRDSTAAYGKGGTAWKALKYAIENDPTFADYWTKQEVDLDNLPMLSEIERAAKVRKIFPVLLLRNFFRAAAESPQGKIQTRRGRKTFEIYRGASSFLAISEGNPRWVIGITRLLLAAANETNRMPVPAFRQASVLEEVMHKFRARLKTMSIGQNRHAYRITTLLSLIDAVGNYFGNEVIERDFSSQPHLTFTVDSTTPTDLVAGIGRALNAGAIVYIPDPDSSALLHDLKGKKFRVSYLMAPFFHLPLRLGESISLSKILKPLLVPPAAGMELGLKEQ